MTSSQTPVEATDRAYALHEERLRVSFRIALWTNVIAVSVLLTAAAAACLLIVVGEEMAALAPALAALADLAFGIVERPWRRLWIASNRLALSQAVWLAYLESKRSISDPLLTDGQRSMLLDAQSLWIDRMAAIGLDDFVAATQSMRDINVQEREVRMGVTLNEVGVIAAVAGYTENDREEGGSLSNV